MSGSRYRFSADMSRAEELDTQNLLAEQVQALEDAGGASGTVTTVSVVTANGVSGSVANPTTTPAITVTLGAITPSSVNASGTVAGSNLSGTNTGDQAAANPTATASDAAVNGSASTFMRSDAAPAIQKASSSVFGVVKVDGTSITASGGVISAPGAGGGTVTTTGSPASGNLTKFSGATSIVNGDLSGDVTTSGTLAVTIANDAVTYAKMQNVSAASKLLGRGSAGGSGDVEEISLSGLTMSSTTLIANQSYEAGPPTPPTTADLSTWVNQGTSTATDGTGALIFQPQVDGNCHIMQKSTPGTPFDVYCRLEYNHLSTAANTTAIAAVAGLVFRDNTNGDFVGFSYFFERVAGDEQNYPAVILQRWNSATSFNSNVTTRLAANPWRWLRVTVSSTTLTCYVSMDGRNWLTVATETIATFVGTVDRYGIYAAVPSNASLAHILFTYFSTTAPV